MAINPVKCFSKDLINKQVPLDVWLQGTIEQTVGNDILIISDNYGRVKITKCTYCCIIGVAVKTAGLPEVQATKFIDLSSHPQMKDSWETEVKEAQLLLQGKLQPIL